MAGLTRTKSSLLRSSPISRPEISDETTGNHQRKPPRNGNTSPRLTHLLAGFFTSLILLTGFIYLRTDDFFTSENLLLALVFIAVTLFYLGKNRKLLNRSKTALKMFYFTNRKKPRSEPVQWFIGEEPGPVHNNQTQEGVEFHSNGDFYEGEFNKGKSNGSGVYYYYINGKYEGDWIDGKYEGYGVESWSKGSKYKGEYKSGLRNGFGVYRFYTGDSYVGKWCHGLYHGFGVQTCCDSSCYVGLFKSGLKHGLGCYNFRNGDRYAGEYFGDKVHGFGVYHFANGHCYEGSWHEGRKQGYGMYTFRNGEAKCGEWDGGSLKTPLPQLTDSVLRAVQAARKAAENAVHLQRADEHVNKAVIAANRAATAARVAAVKAVRNRMEGKFHDTYV